MLKSSEAWKLEQQESLQAGFMRSSDSLSLFKHLLLSGFILFFLNPSPRISHLSKNFGSC